MLNTEQVWNKKRGKREAWGHFCNLRMAPFSSWWHGPPRAHLSLSLCSSSSSSSPPPQIQPQAQKNSINFPQPNLKSPSFNLPQNQTKLWCKFGQKFEGFRHVFRESRRDFEALNACLSVAMQSNFRLLQFFYKLGVILNTAHPPQVQVTKWTFRMNLGFELHYLGWLERICMGLGEVVARS